jgi:hypothetical protein
MLPIVEWRWPGSFGFGVHPILDQGPKLRPPVPFHSATDRYHTQKGTETAVSRSPGRWRGGEYPTCCLGYFYAVYTLRDRTKQPRRLASVPRPRSWLQHRAITTAAMPCHAMRCYAQPGGESLDTFLLSWAESSHSCLLSTYDREWRGRK